MADPRILSIGRAVPSTSYTQAELYAHRPWPATALTDRLFLDSPVHRRALFVPPSFYATPRTLTETNDAWREGATGLGRAALVDAIGDREPTDIGWLGVTTVTGYTTPGLDLLLARDLAFRDDVARVHFNNIGCHAAVPLLRTAAEHVAADADRLAAAVAVEVCSACFSDSDDAENLVAISLFGDGAAAVVVGGSGDGPRIVDFGSVYDFEHQDALGFELTATGFRIVLDPSIPRIIATHIDRAVDDLLTRAGVPRERVHTWCLHPGGSRIIDAVQAALGLSDDEVRSSRRVLRAYGNMSSPTVLFVLAESLTSSPPPPGTFGVLASFGPGLGIEVGLLAF
ncbi:MAG: alkylresorcinol/alkylpyrone synthase [Myxococcota bacterium]|jgi:alkylresorcinol/alkylpyrone synthase